MTNNYQQLYEKHKDVIESPVIKQWMARRNNPQNYNEKESMQNLNRELEIARKKVEQKTTELKVSKLFALAKQI